MRSEASLSVGLVYKAAGRPLPTFSEDDYVDWCVMEAVVTKLSNFEDAERKRQEEKAKHDKFKNFDDE